MFKSVKRMSEETKNEAECAACNKSFPQDELTKGVCGGCRKEAAAVGINFEDAEEEPKEVEVVGPTSPVEDAPKKEPEPLKDSKVVPVGGGPSEAETVPADLPTEEKEPEKEEPAEADVKPSPPPEEPKKDAPEEKGESEFTPEPDCIKHYDPDICSDPNDCIHAVKCLPATIKAMRAETRAAKHTLSELDKANKVLFKALHKDDRAMLKQMGLV